jgi:hypothetical protein
VTVWVYPVVVGGGTAAFTDAARLDLELVDTRSYAAGVVGLRYLPVR